MAGITVNVRVTDTDDFQNFLNIIKEFISDERVPKDVKQEFKNKILSTANKS